MILFLLLRMFKEKIKYENREFFDRGEIFVWSGDFYLFRKDD